ncbi:MAG: hypothetical protein HQ536_02355 [Parcubacteria group bacterium]|nr:hypothetical protein [Parcubacteria group bacterium]
MEKNKDTSTGEGKLDRKGIFDEKGFNREKLLQAVIDEINHTPAIREIIENGVESKKEIERISRLYFGKTYIGNMTVDQERDYNRQLVIDDPDRLSPEQFKVEEMEDLIITIADRLVDQAVEEAGLKNKFDLDNYFYGRLHDYLKLNFEKIVDSLGKKEK